MDSAMADWSPLRGSARFLWNGVLPERRDIRRQVSLPRHTRAIADLHAAFQSTGGIANSNEMTVRLRAHYDQPISQLARWIVARDVVSYTDCSETFLPLFQFELAQMSPRQDVRTVIAELVSVFDDLELAWWFAESNAWLSGSTPVDSLRGDPGAVLNAARADRFVANG